jgi:calcium/proton exchanger cax
MDGSQKSPELSTTDKEAERHGATKSDDGEGDEQVPELSLPVALSSLVVATVLIGVTADGLVHSVDGLASRNLISKEFIGFILLPIVGNAPGCFAAVTASVKDKLTSGLVATIGSSIVSSLSSPIVPPVTCTTLNLPPPSSKFRYSSSRSSSSLGG